LLLDATELYQLKLLAFPVIEKIVSVFPHFQNIVEMPPLQVVIEKNPLKI
jgi:hypothetical protein